MGSGRNDTRYPDNSAPTDRPRGATLLSRRCPFRLKKRQREDTMSKYLFLGPGRWQSLYCYCRVRSGHLRNGSYCTSCRKATRLDLDQLSAIPSHSFPYCAVIYESHHTLSRIFYVQRWQYTIRITISFATMCSTGYHRHLRTYQVLYKIHVAPIGTLIVYNERRPMPDSALLLKASSITIVWHMPFSD